MGIDELILNGNQVLGTNTISSSIEFKQDTKARKIDELINHLEKEFSFKDATYNEKLLYRLLIELLETF